MTHRRVPGSQHPDPRPVRAVALLHQEGVLGLIAIVGLAFRAGGPMPALAPTIAPFTSLAIGLTAGFGSSLVLWLVRKVPPLRELQWFQQRLVQGWTVSDVLAVAVLSGVAEEALLRALLQPIIGLLPAAALFAVLHLVPDRRLWLWPVIAFVLGMVLGLLYETAGYPAAATAHVAINACALLRLRHLNGAVSP
jgi:membrane protease YdiL (CAAX protease family)